MPVGMHEAAKEVVVLEESLFKNDRHAWNVSPVGIANRDRSHLLGISTVCLSVMFVEVGGSFRLL